MTTPITVRSKLRVNRREEVAVITEGRIPRITRLLALAHRFEQLIRDGVVADYAELARLGHVSRARLTQIMDLLNLAPDIQEEILLMQFKQERNRISERQLRGITRLSIWVDQRRLLSKIEQASGKLLGDH